MNNKSSIFLSDLSVVDHAYINEHGQVIGGSFNPGFIVTGSIDSVEQVVIDFSTVKKSLKQLIDQHIWDPEKNGFDHKIWWIEGFSKGTIEKSDHADRYIINTPALTAEVPTDALKIIKNTDNYIPNHSIEYIGQSLEQFLTKEMIKLYPDVNVKVECFNNINVHLINKNIPYKYFTYSHGLKDSTSYGCQNLLHGHLSFIQYHNDDIITRIANDLNDAVFVNRSNIIIDNENELTLTYTTPQRGYFTATYKKDSNKIIILDTETTIEWIAEFVKDTYQITDFYISEGLSKGTYI